MRFRSLPCAKGFTLVELLVVIAIIGILVAMLLPAVQAAREAARRIQCNNHMKQMGLAFLLYHDASRAFPPSVMDWGTKEHSCMTLILPFLEQQAVYDQYDFRFSWRQYAATKNDIAVYLCPSNTIYVIEHGSADYAACYGSNFSDNVIPYSYGKGGSWRSGIGVPTTGVPSYPMFDVRPVSISDVHDGTSNTILFTEWAAAGGTLVDNPVTQEFKEETYWANGGRAYGNSDPINRKPGWFDIYSFHPGGAHVLLARISQMSCLTSAWNLRQPFENK